MADSSTTEMYLLLTDESGNLYAIPRPTVESYRMTDEQKERLEQALGEDVSGYLMNTNAYMLENMARQRVADRHLEADQERISRLMRGEGERSERLTATSSAPSNVISLVTGVWRSLPKLRPGYAT